MGFDVLLAHLRHTAFRSLRTNPFSEVDSGQTFRSKNYLYVFTFSHFHPFTFSTLSALSTFSGQLCLLSGRTASVDGARRGCLTSSGAGPDVDRTIVGLTMAWMGVDRRQ